MEHPDEVYARRERFILADLALGLLPEGTRLAVLDAGARDAFDDGRWQALDPARLIVHGFEPDAAECQRLNGLAGAKGLAFRYHAVGLDRAAGTRTLYALRHPSASSAFAPNESLLARWRYGTDVPVMDVMGVVAETAMSVADLDGYAAAHALPSFDFVKLNVQGSELAILEGAGARLDSVLGIQIELSFGPTYIGAPLFADIDPFLRGRGFAFFDILSRHAVGRTASPLAFDEPPLAQWRWPSRQVFEGHFLYLRDPVAAGPGAFTGWQVLKLAAVAELYGQVEYAFELVARLAAHPISDGLEPAAAARLLEAARERYRRIFPDITHAWREAGVGTTAPPSAAAAPLPPFRPRPVPRGCDAAVGDLVAAETARAEARLPLRLMDFGCGGGQLLHHLAGSGLPLRLHGCDCDAGRVAVLAAAPAFAGVELVRADIRTARWHRSFDVAVLSAVLLHMEEDGAASVLAAVRAGLDDGGALILYDLIHEAEQDLAVTETQRGRRAAVTMHLRSRGTLSRLLRAAGFDAVSFHPFAPPADLPQPADPRDLTTFTRQIVEGGRLVFRGALCQPWCLAVARTRSGSADGE